MSPDEIISELKKMDINISRSTLLRYEKAGMVSEPLRGGQGRGKGRVTDYPNDVVGEVYAAYYMLHNQNLTPRNIKMTREEAMKFVMNFYKDTISEIYENMTQEQILKSSTVYITIDTLIYEWLALKAKAIFKLDLNKKINIFYSWNNTTESWEWEVSYVDSEQVSLLKAMNTFGIKNGCIVFEEEGYCFSFVCVPSSEYAVINELIKK